MKEDIKELPPERDVQHCEGRQITVRQPTTMIIMINGEEQELVLQPGTYYMEGNYRWKG